MPAPLICAGLNVINGFGRAEAAVPKDPAQQAVGVRSL